LPKSDFYRAFADYNREQCIPTKIQNSEEECLITEANDLSDGRFYDPRTKQSFKYVHFPNEDLIELYK
jgi:capping protein alpha